MTVHFIGAGPGAADLITVRGRDLLARCQILSVRRIGRVEGTARLLPIRSQDRRYGADVPR